jgi:hypothetical protein
MHSIDALDAYDRVLAPFLNMWEKIIMSRKTWKIEQFIDEYADALKAEEKAEIRSKLVIFQAYLKKLAKEESIDGADDEVVSYLVKTWKQTGLKLTSEKKVKDSVCLHSVLLKRFHFIMKPLKSVHKVKIVEA